MDDRAVPVTSTPDAIPGHWLVRLLPPAFVPYARLMRLDRPIGWWLLLLPCWWSSALAADAAASPPDLRHLILFLVGSVAMRGAGCTYNDIVDRDIDAAVLRTRSRPIPSGEVTIARAKLFLLAQALIGLVVLLQFNRFTVLLGIASLATIAVYPFMKRFTDWPQVALGIAFSWGGLMGWAAFYGRLDWPPVLLYAGGILWTVGYDTIYAHQDKEDDALIGVRSTALLFGTRTRAYLAGFYAAATVLFAAALVAAGVGWLAYAGLIAATLQLAWQVVRLDIDDPQDCLRKFRSNRDYGFILLAGVLADSLARSL
jgi:4-hydroxybenzoate polyprenyltransferase